MKSIVTAVTVVLIEAGFLLGVAVLPEPAAPPAASLATTQAPAAAPAVAQGVRARS